MPLEPAHNVSVRKLPCGLTVTVDPLPHSGLTSFFLRVDCGLRHEGPQENGLAHLVEHAVFLGTESLSEDDVSDHFDAMGSDLDAMTDQESTTFAAMVLPESLPEALRVVSELVGCPTFDPDKLEREKRIITDSEILGRSLSSSERLSERVYGAAFPGHAMGAPLAGTAESVGSFDQAAVRRFFDSSYRSEAMTLSVCGSVPDPDAVFAAAEAHFGRWVRRGPGRSTKAAAFGGPELEIVFEHEDEAQVGFGLLFGAPSKEDERNVEVTVLSLVLGIGSSSRLFRRVRQDHGYCYQIQSVWNPYSDTGIFQVDAQLQPETAHLAATEVLDVLRDFVEKGPTEEELERAKIKAKIGIRLINEVPLMRMMTTISHLSSYGRIRTFAEAEEKVRRCSRESVRELAAEIFSGRAVLGLCGPEASCREVADVVSSGSPLGSRRSRKPPVGG